MLPKIKPGDVVKARKQNTVTDGDLVIYFNNEVTIIKKYGIQNSNVILESLNSEKYTPSVACEDFKVVGIVKNIIHCD